MSTAHGARVRTSCRRRGGVVGAVAGPEHERPVGADLAPLRGARRRPYAAEQDRRTGSAREVRSRCRVAGKNRPVRGLRCSPGRRGARLLPWTGRRPGPPADHSRCREAALCRLGRAKRNSKTSVRRGPSRDRRIRRMSAWQCCRTRPGGGAGPRRGRRPCGRRFRWRGGASRWGRCTGRPLGLDCNDGGRERVHT